jgi:prepilin-type N-terminal cleavage/methylation domain-containing protein
MRQYGFSFIEILISLSIISFLIFSMDFIQVNSLRAQVATYYYAMATLAAKEIMEKLTFPALQNKNEIIHQWQASVSEILPKGRAYLTQQSEMTNISITWGEETEKKCEQTKIEMNGCLYVSY